MSLKALQSKIGVKPDGKFGPITFRAAAAHLHLSDNRAVHFFAQCCHESGHFTRFEENLNYSADALLRVFKNHFTAAEAAEYERQPERIANRAYANRMGNGDEASGDGWKFRGRGPLQLTGRNNYENFARTVGIHKVNDVVELVATERSFDSAIWFFNANKLWSICDTGLDEDTITKLTRAINGGYNGLAERIDLTRKFEGYLK